LTLLPPTKQWRRKMKSYMFLKMSSTNVDIWCSDVNSVAWIVPKVKQIIPWCRSFSDKERFSITKLENRDYEIAWKVIQWLTEDGWEPFAVSSSETHYFFRKERSNN
jgi:hypothetical protein